MKEAWVGWEGIWSVCVCWGVGWVGGYISPHEAVLRYSHLVPERRGHVFDIPQRHEIQQYNRHRFTILHHDIQQYSGHTKFNSTNVTRDSTIQRHQIEQYSVTPNSTMQPHNIQQHSVTRDSTTQRHPRFNNTVSPEIQQNSVTQDSTTQRHPRFNNTVSRDSTTQHQGPYVR